MASAVEESALLDALNDDLLTSILNNLQLEDLRTTKPTCERLCFLARAVIRNPDWREMSGNRGNLQRAMWIEGCFTGRMLGEEPRDEMNYACQGAGAIFSVENCTRIRMWDLASGVNLHTWDPPEALVESAKKNILLGNTTSSPPTFEMLFQILKFLNTLK